MRAPIYVPCPRGLCRRTDHGIAGIFMKVINMIFDKPRPRPGMKKRNEPERYLKFTFHSWMCKQALLAPKIATTSSITSKRFWRNEKICTYIWSCSADFAGARAYFASFLFALSQNLILYARLTSRCLLCKPKLNEHKCLIMRRDSIDI